jgi:uncharacterized delta-60 repeat protein
MRRLFACLFLVVITLFFLSVKDASCQAELRWLAEYNGSNIEQSYCPEDMILDGQGNIYLTGHTTVVAPWEYDLMAMKYTSGGQLFWVHNYNESSHSSDNGLFLKLDSQGNLVVTGISKRTNESIAFTIVKYDTSGAQAWVETYPNPPSLETELNGMGLDSDGNIYLCGSIPDSGVTVGFDIVLLKYNADGQLLWQTRYNGPDSEFTMAAGMIVDSTGDIIIAGHEINSPNENYNSMLMKYNTDGEQIWKTIYFEPELCSNRPTCLSKDSDGNIVVSGIVTNPGESTDYLTIKYDPLGNIDWVRRFEPIDYSVPFTTQIFTEPEAMTIDSDNNICLTGVAIGYDKEELLTIKYGSDGDFLWNAYFTGTPSYLNYPSDIVTDRWNNVYVVGSSGRNMYGYTCDYITIKYDPRGNEQWNMRYGQYILGNDQGIEIELNSQDEVIVSGQSEEETSLADEIVTMCYAQDQSGTDYPDHNLPGPIELMPAYPNPFNSQTIISYNLPTGSQVRLDIFDILGNNVATIFNEEQTAGFHKIAWNADGLPSGIYFYQVKTDSHSESRKVVLIR